MTYNQRFILRQLMTALNSLSEEAEQDENFNMELAEVIQKENITNRSIEDINYIISQHLE